MYSLFGEHKQCELMCKTSANHTPYLNHFPTSHSRVSLHTSASDQILNYLVQARIQDFEMGGVFL